MNEAILLMDEAGDYIPSGNSSMYSAIDLGSSRGNGGGVNNGLSVVIVSGDCVSGFGHAHDGGSGNVHPDDADVGNFQEPLLFNDDKGDK